MKRIQLNRWVLLSMTSLALACTIITNPSGSSDRDAGTGGAPSNVFDAGTGGAPSTAIDAGTGGAPSTQIDAGSNASMPAPSIEGSYVDNFGYPISITADTLTLGAPGDASLPSVFHLVQVDNANSFAIARNDANNSYNPGLWSRFDWAKDSDQVLRYCQTAYKAETAEQALQTPVADAQDFAQGCAGFSWSKLTPTS